MYCAKELTRHMATPTTTDWEQVVRLGRYLSKRPRVRLWYKFQETACQLETFSDTDWAGCRRTRRSTTAKIHRCRIPSHQNVVQNTSCCGSQFSGSRIVRLGESVGRNNGTHIDVQRSRHTHEWSGRCERSSRHCGPTRLDKLRQLDTNYLWLQEKAAKGDLNFKKVAGVDNGADTFTKSLSWNEIQSHIHKLSSQFVQNEISVHYVGARPNGVNLPRILQEMGLAGDRNLAAWTPTDVSSRTRRKTMKGGPVWSDVVARVTADAVSGEILDSELARDTMRSLEHTPLEGRPRDIQTILVFEASRVKSPSPILQDSVRRGRVRGYGQHNSCNCWAEMFGERTVLESELFESLSPLLILICSGN